MSGCIIEAVRVADGDGQSVQLPWKAGTSYGLRDDHPYLDILVRGNPASAAERAVKLKETEEVEQGLRWQRWDLEPDLARQRRVGEVSLALKVPQNAELRCYVLPTALLSYRDVVSMVGDIEVELGISATWDRSDPRNDRAWSDPTSQGRPETARELVRLAEEELRSARSIRREPFAELGPKSLRNVFLPENAFVAHWAIKRGGQLRDASMELRVELDSLVERARRIHPVKRQERIDNRIAELSAGLKKVDDLSMEVSQLCDHAQLSTPISSSPLFQRDYRLRQMLRAFAPRPAEIISEIEAARSHYPPTFLNRLWEVWGAVWLARQFKQLGFTGSSLTGAANSTESCSWRLKREDILVEIDYEPEPVYVDYEKVPPLSRRNEPVLEWVSRNQHLDAERPFIGLEIKCSPDYLIRITTPSSKVLMVGDACLAHPDHHGTKRDKADTKPYIVERYRRTIGWATDGQIVRCHELGGFVVFPPPEEAWDAFRGLPGAADCSLLCPKPGVDPAASRSWIDLLYLIAPTIHWVSRT